MPNIRELNVGPLGLRPSEVGVEAVAGAARRIGAFGNQKAQALDTLGQRAGGAIRDAGDAAVAYEDHREISHGAATGASLINDLSNQWNEAAKNADPNDPSIAGKFREEVLEPRLQQFSEGFSTKNSQAWAEHFVDGFRQHMFQKTTADMSSLAADAVHMNVEQTRNALVNATYNDPSSLNFSRDALAHSTDGLIGSSPNLSAPSASKVRQDLTFKGEQELVHAAISGTIAKGGDWQAIANDPKNAPYINRPALETFAKAQKVQDRLNEREAKNDKIADQQETDRQAGQQINKIINGITYDDSDQPHFPKGTVNQLAEVLRKNPDASEKVRKDIEGEIARIGRTQGKQITADNMDVRNDLNTRMLDPDHPTTRLQVLQAQDKLTPRTFRQLEGIQKEVEQGHLHDPAFKAVMTGARQTLGTDPIGGERYGQWAPGFYNQYLAEKRAGTLQPNALNTNDPDSMISKSLTPYKRTPQQMLVDRLSHGLIADVNSPGFGSAAQQGTGVKATIVRQNGHTYTLQPDGSYK